MAVYTKVAPISKGQVTSDMLQKALGLQEQATNAYGEIPSPVEDPRQTVQAAVESYMPQPVEVPPITVPVVDQPQIIGMEDVATNMGSQFGSRPVSEPVLDDQGNPVINQETGTVLTRMVSPTDFAGQQSMEQASQQNINSALMQLNEDPNLYAKPALQQLQAEHQATLGGANARIQARDTLTQDEIDRGADSSAPALSQLTNQARSALFSADSKVKSALQMEDGTSVPIATGIKAALESGYSDQDAIASIGTVFGLSLAKAATQTPMEKGESNANRVVSTDGKVIDDADYFNNTINSVKHFARTGLERMGIKLTPQSLNEMSKAIVLDAVQRGDLMVFHDESGRPVVQVNKQLKSTSKKLQQAAEIVVGDYNRRRSSTTPARSGTSFSAGRPQMTRKSIRTNGITTTAAEATKDILGSVAYNFAVKDVQYKEIELNLIMENLETDQQSQQPKWSNHWAAERNGVSKKDFEAAKLKVAPPENFNPNDPEQARIFEIRKEAQAREVIDMKLKQLQNDIANAKQSPGNRYSEWIHSLFNQRFFPNSFDVDYMGSKAGIRDMLGFGFKDVVRPDFLFDQAQVKRLISKGMSILTMRGQDQNEALSKLPDAERGAIGTMINAVINYYSAVGGNDSNIVKQPPAELLSRYTVDIGNKLAEVGKEYNAFLLDPKSASNEIQSLLAGMEKGESMGSKNLWDDMFNLQQASKDVVKSRTYTYLTHHAFDDGNQNGIFLQALFFGNTDNAIRLGTFNPNLDDMREFATSTMIANLEEQLKDNEEVDTAFKLFFKALKDNYSKASFSKEIFKKPLMQNSYGKDASMFGDMMIDLLADVYPKESEKFLAPAFNGDLTKAAGVLNQALESTLREVINADGANMMKSIGRFTAVMNSTVMVEGVSGDTYVFTPVGLVPVNKANDNGETMELALPSGEKVLVKYKAKEADVFQTPEGEVSVSTEGMAYNPSAAKPTQMFYNKTTKSWDPFHNALGTSQMRMMVVMPIQSIDGDLVKMTTLAVNKNRSTPLPVMWVHDSIISSPGSALIYRNAYNNISIPNAIPQIAKFGKKFKQVVDSAFRDETEAVLSRGVPVGIGEQGDYPAMGALFDEQWERIQDTGNYKQIFLERKYNNEEKWEKYKAKVNKLLKVASDNGWKAPNAIRSTETKSAKDIRDHLAVTPRQFKELANLAKEMLQLGGPEERLNSWVNNFEKNVNRTGSALMTAARKNGIGQMSYGATGSRANIEMIKPKDKTEGLTKIGEQEELPIPDSRDVNTMLKDAYEMYQDKDLDGLQMLLDNSRDQFVSDAIKRYIKSLSQEINNNKRFCR